MLLRGFSLHTRTYLIGTAEVKQPFHNELKHRVKYALICTRFQTAPEVLFSLMFISQNKILKESPISIPNFVESTHLYRPIGQRVRKRRGPIFHPGSTDRRSCPGLIFRPPSLFLSSHQTGGPSTGSSLGFSFKTKSTAIHRYKSYVDYRISIQFCFGRTFWSNRWPKPF